MFRSPTIIRELVLNLAKFILKFILKYTQILLLHTSVYDHHQGASTESGQSYIYIKTFSEITSLSYLVIWLRAAISPASASRSICSCSQAVS